jgi:hypothetical protein
MWSDLLQQELSDLKEENKQVGPKLRAVNQKLIRAIEAYLVAANV